MVVAVVLLAICYKLPEMFQGFFRTPPGGKDRVRLAVAVLHQSVAVLAISAGCLQSTAVAVPTSAGSLDGPAHPHAGVLQVLRFIIETLKTVSA